MFLTRTCHSKRNRMILCRARRAWWSWAEINSILSSLSCWWCSKSCDEIAPTSGSHPRSEGWGENQLSYSREKNFFHSSILFILAIILMDESSYISWFTWYLWKILLQLENAKWGAASPTVKGITAPTNNQQSKALNINFKTNPNDNG